MYLYSTDDSTGNFAHLYSTSLTHMKEAWLTCARNKKLGWWSIPGAPPWNMIKENLGIGIWNQLSLLVLDWHHLQFALSMFTW